MDCPFTVRRKQTAEADKERAIVSSETRIGTHIANAVRHRVSVPSKCEVLTRPKCTQGNSMELGNPVKTGTGAPEAERSAANRLL